MSSGIGVVIPVFNAEAYLAEAIESVFDQSLEPVEVIVVDDGSTDRSARIARSLGSDVLTIEHAGNAAALNHGVRSISAPTLAFLDADDVWPLDRCEVLAAMLEGDPGLDAAVGSIDEFVSPEIGAEEAVRLRVPNRGAPSYLSSAMLIRRSAFERVGYFDESLPLGIGLEWAGRVPSSGIVVGRTDRVVLRRRLHGANSGVRLREQRSTYARILKERLDRIRAEGGSP